MDLEKAYDRVNREAIWQVLRIYDAEGKLFDEIKLSSSSLRSNPSMHH